VTDAVTIAPVDSVGVAIIPPAIFVSVDSEAPLFTVPLETTEKLYFLPCVKPVMLA